MVVRDQADGRKIKEGAEQQIWDTRSVLFHVKLTWLHSHLAASQ